MVPNSSRTSFRSGGPFERLPTFFPGC
uniref:Uncharacterized protein n=1 Tax=Rhizophora mucronata TaxID=61149 RepID=A0A2P2IYP5_RHIMU